MIPVGVDTLHIKRPMRKGALILRSVHAWLDTSKARKADWIFYRFPFNSNIPRFIKESQKYANDLKHIILLNNATVFLGWEEEII